MIDAFEKQAIENFNRECPHTYESAPAFAIRAEAGRLRAEDEVKGLRSRVAKGEELLANWRKRSAEAEERAEKAEALLREWAAWSVDEIPYPEFFRLKRVTAEFLSPKEDGCPNCGKNYRACSCDDPRSNGFIG